MLVDFQMSEKHQEEITLHGISADVMEVLLDFVYTETVNVSVENVQELLPAACLLQLTGGCYFLILQQLTGGCYFLILQQLTGGCYFLMYFDVFEYQTYDSIVHEVLPKIGRI